MNKEIRYFTREHLGTLVAARPETGSAIIFNSRERKWESFKRIYAQIASDISYDRVTEEKALMIFKDIPPDEKLLDYLDSFNNY